MPNPDSEDSKPQLTGPGCCGPSREADVKTRGASLAAPARRSASSSAERMVRLEGGAYLMGTEDPNAFPLDGEGPVREVHLDPFYLDRFPVTNQGFARFVADTGYKTEAEQFGWSFVFANHIPAHLFSRTVLDTVLAAPWWCQVPGADWAHPEGPESSIAGRERHPAVHVSWNDAASYCAWSERRLPTEAEWEFAARGGLVQKVYPWGDELTPGGQHRCNIWQGDFPRTDLGEDGYTGTCPVDAFPPNGYGLFSMTGNTWEWCADWFSPSFHLTADRHSPTGPPAGQAKVIRGGSFLCHASYCNRYRVAARTSNTPDSTTAHLGFRCAQDC